MLVIRTGLKRTTLRILEFSVNNLKRKGHTLMELAEYVLGDFLEVHPQRGGYQTHFRIIGLSRIAGILKGIASKWGQVNFIT